MGIGETCRRRNRFRSATAAAPQINLMKSSTLVKIHSSSSADSLEAKAQ
jgi:hypothetical protein